MSRKINENPDSALLEFHIFDYQGSVSQWERIHRLRTKEEAGNIEKPLVYVPFTIVSSLNWLEQATAYTSEGYEGIILRGAIWSYEKKRSLYMLKFKPTEQDTYKIAGVLEAISKEGNPKGMVGAFHVYGDDGTVFDVGAGKLTHPERVRYWENRGDLVGKNLIVKHELLKTVGGVPLCSVAVQVVE